jgi:hypothetical protein
METKGEEGEKISMQGPSWIALLERIPAKHQDTLVLTLVTGAEIMMQAILRLESDYAILRGRMAGSTDAGRVILLPYDQIVNVAFTKRMLQPEVEAIFGQLRESPAGGAAPTGEEAEAPMQEAEEMAQDAANEEAAAPSPMRPAPPSPAPAAAGAGKNAPLPSKSLLLARLRARLAEQGKQ